MPHWRTLVQSEYFCAADLWDDKADGYRKAIFKIVKVTQGTVVGEKGRKRGLPFLTLEDVNGKAQRAPFGANPTNNRAIEQALGTGDYAKWVGQWIGMYVTKVDSPNGMVDAIRVAPKRVEPPKPGQKGEQKSEPLKSDAPPANEQQNGDLSDAEKRALEMAENAEARNAR